MAHHGVAGFAGLNIKIVGALPVRRVHRQLVCPRRDQVIDQFLQVRLDAARRGGKSLLTSRTRLIACQASRTSSAAIEPAP